MLSFQTSLQPFHTFGTPTQAAAFGRFRSEPELRTLLSEAKPPVLILGGGSNMLFRTDFPGTVLRNEIRGIEKIREDQDSIWLRVGGGEDWHEFVMHCVRSGWAGVENLALIPGTVGAAPIQNIGAYGVELREVFEELEALCLETGEKRHFSAAECQFGYRNSIFKQSLKGQYAITYVRFRLRKTPDFKLSYGALRELFTDRAPTLEAVSDAVIQIRQRKLPNPQQIGNSGSFFKNPVIGKAPFQELQKRYPNIPHYPQEEGVKVPAGWLIEQCGWKGKRVGNTGTYAKQALVIVNHGGATGEEIYQLSEAILQSVKSRFGIRLEREVNVFGG